MTNITVGSSAFYDQLTPENAAMLLIDHQAGLFLGVHSIDQQILKNNVTNWIAVAAELKHDEDRATTPAMNQAFGEHMGLYDFLGDIAAVKAHAPV